MSTIQDQLVNFVLTDAGASKEASAEVDHEDFEKSAHADAFLKVASDNGIDLEQYSDEEIKEAFDRTGRNTEATMEGLSATASVISSAALIMIFVFGAFAFARVLVMQFLGFGLAVAVLLDATVIRMVLVPAFMHLMGKWNWWPGGQRPPEHRL